MIRRILRASLLAAALLGTASSASLAESLAKTNAAAAGFSTPGLERITTYLKKEIAEKRIPGAAIMIQRNGQLAYFEGFGTRSPDAREPARHPVKADTIFRIYSMTKPVTSVVIMMLVEEGKIQLSDPVSKYIPAFANMQVGVERKGDNGRMMLDLVASKRPITIHDLLRHTSGLTYGIFGKGLVKDAYLQANLMSEDADNEHFANTIAQIPLMHQPGTTWEYSHSTDVLGRVIEVVTGKPLRTAFNDMLFTPLGMKDTSFYVTDAKKHPRIAEPFAHDRAIGTGAVMFDPRVKMKWESGGGGLVSTITDYARFTRMLLNGGALDGKRYLSPKTIAYMSANHIAPETGITRGPLYIPGPGFAFGLGFAVRTDEGTSPLLGSVGEINWAGVGGTTFWIDPKEDMFVILMAQTVKERMRIRNTLRNLVYGAMEK